MNTYLRTALTLGVQLALLASVAAKYQFDRVSDAHVLIKVRPVDPESPIKGRYLTLRVEAPAPLTIPTSHLPVEVALSVQQQRLVVSAAPGSGQLATVQTCGIKACWVLSQPLEFYIPEHAITPGAGVLLWVDATLPRKGPPRPIGLVREEADGHFTPLDFN